MKDIVKALKCCTGDFEEFSCKNCPYDSEYDTTDCTCILAENALDLIEEQAKMLKWTACSDELPSMQGEYLVSDGVYVWIAQFAFICGTKGWLNNAKNPSVVAWMPLPKPYKGSDCCANRSD